jgi:Ca-activated chloride channel homolog
VLSFQHIENLLTLIGIPVLIVLFILLVRWKKAAIARIGDLRLVKLLISDYSPNLFAFKFVLIVIAFALCAFAVADLAKPEPNSNVKLKGIDVMIALDVSNSMLADDIKPNRLERAKQVVTRLIDKLGDNRIGLVIFAGKAYLQMPLHRMTCLPKALFSVMPSRCVMLLLILKKRNTALLF